MNISVDVVRNSPQYSRVSEDRIPEIEAYEDGHGNIVFIAKDASGKERVLDRYVVVRDVKGVIIVTMRECGLGLRIRNIFEGIASVLLLVASPKLRAILSLVGVDYAEIRQHVERVAGLAEDEKVRELVSAFGGEVAEEIRELVHAALLDGELSVEEWSAIQALAASARK